MKTGIFDRSRGRKFALVVCGALLTGMLWRVRGTHGWGSSWGLLNVGFVYMLFLASVLKPDKRSLGVMGLAAFSFMLTTPAWGTLNSQITGVLSIVTPGMDTVEVFVSPAGGVALMLLMGFGLAGVFGVMLGICFGGGKRRLVPEIVCVAAAALAVSYASKASIAHPLVGLIEPQAAETFSQGLRQMGSDLSVYKAYLAHFNSEAWAKTVFGGRNYYACVSAVSSALGAVAAIVTARVVFKDRFAAKTGAVVCSSFAAAITLSDLFFFFSNGGYRHSQGFALPDGFAAWSLWEYFTGFIAGALITAYMLKNAGTRRDSPDAERENGGNFFRIAGCVVFTAAAAVNFVRPMLVRSEFSVSGIVASVAVGVCAVAVCLLYFKNGRLLGFGTDICSLLCVLLIVCDLVMYMFFGDDPNIRSVSDVHNILVIVSAAYCAAIITVFRRYSMGKIEPLYDGVRLLCVITTDNHIASKHSVSPKIPLWFNGRALKDSQQSKVPVDLFLTIGDTTSQGTTDNWELVKGLFSKYKPAKQILLTVGNHDLWNDDGGFDAAQRNYLDYSNLICGTRHDKTWFSHTVNGCRFIFLGNTEPAGCEAHLGREQIEWLKGELDAADGKPAFVFCHQSLNGKHGLPVTWDASGKSDDPLDGGLGEESDEVEAILKAHKNVFYFSGHSHMGLGGENCLKQNGYASFENDDGVELINLPSMSCGNHHGEDKSTGIGCMLEVYDDRVVLRPRNFAKRTYVDKVAIRDGKPYLEKMLDL